MTPVNRGQAVAPRVRTGARAADTPATRRPASISATAATGRARKAGYSQRPKVLPPVDLLIESPSAARSQPAAKVRLLVESLVEAFRGRTWPA